eukprot:g26111.t1
MGNKCCLASDILIPLMNKGKKSQEGCEPDRGDYSRQCRSKYMDNVAVFCSDPLSVSRIVSICDKFKLASVVKVNQGKSEAMFFWEPADRFFLPFTVRTDYLKMLAIWFRGAGVWAKPSEEHIAKVRQKLSRWEHHSLSVSGKILHIRCDA